jgi:hypothetical protein
LCLCYQVCMLLLSLERLLRRQRAIDGPQLAWGWSAVDPRTNRYRSDIDRILSKIPGNPPSRTLFFTDARRRSYDRLLYT